LQTAKPLDLDDKHEIIRRVHQERDQAPRRPARKQLAQRHRDVITLITAAPVLHWIHKRRAADPRLGSCRRELGTPAALGGHARRPPPTSA